uniref:Ig-like domain-containing protein n=1 Tax=Glossina brevipalpis TaxID=37001 RepID=A0A1A9X015_9MUSC
MCTPINVSWVRHRDIHLLTVGRYTYTSDQRFEAMHSPHAEDWTLRIRYAQRKDSGTYECQISTTPPIGHSVYLNIVVGVRCTKELAPSNTEPETLIEIRFFLQNKCEYCATLLRAYNDKRKQHQMLTDNGENFITFLKKCVLSLA